MTKIKPKLSPPWVTFFNKIKAMFGQDPDIKIEYDNDNIEVRLYVDNPIKAEILSEFIEDEVRIGYVCLKIKVIPSNDGAVSLDGYTTKTKFELLFDGNPAFSFAKSIEGIFSNTITYVVFKCKVCQFFNDNLNDIYGNTSMLYEDIADDIFDNIQGVCFCTDLPEDEGVVVKKAWP